MNRSSDRTTVLPAYPLAAGLLFGAALLRTLLTGVGSPLLGRALLLLLGWLALSGVAVMLDRSWPGWFPLYLAVQSVLVVLLISMSRSTDFFAILFAIPAAQIMQRYPVRWGAAILGLFVPIMAFPLAETQPGADAVALVVTYSALIALLGAYGLAGRRAREGHARNQALVGELQKSNQQLEAYSAQLEHLAVARERQRLMRDLHDSVTQTIFSMTLTTQSALVLAERDPPRVGEMLNRLTELTQHAQAEMKALVTELRPLGESPGLAAALRSHISGHAIPAGLSVALEVEGSGRLLPLEEQNLFRIAQEALNNVVKHSNSTRALVRLRLQEPFSLEIEDEGRGFDPAAEAAGRGLGLAGMKERAAAMGWTCRVMSAMDSGTRIVVEKHGQ